MSDGYIWAMFFAGLVSIKAHPKNYEDVDLFYCADLADRMLAFYKERFHAVDCSGN